MNPIPQFLQNFRMYTNGTVLTGVDGDVALPNFENTAETISGAGILGEFESQVPGSFKSLAIEINFRILDQNLFNLASQTGTSSLTFRGSQQIYDIASGGTVNQAVRLESRGKVKGIDGGKASVGKPFGSKFTQEVLFIAIYLNDAEVLYLDKLNFIYRINGVDQLAGILQNM